MTPFDYDALDPGIRETVRRLNGMCFKTTDSGDGVSKLADGAEVLDVPHVFMRVPADQLVSEADRLRNELEAAGICVEPVGHSSIYIQANYDPSDGSAMIMLFGVSDSAWRSDGLRS